MCNVQCAFVQCANKNSHNAAYNGVLGVRLTCYGLLQPVLGFFNQLFSQRYSQRQGWGLSEKLTCYGFWRYVFGYFNSRSCARAFSFGARGQLRWWEGYMLPSKVPSLYCILYVYQVEVGEPDYMLLSKVPRPSCVSWGTWLHVTASCLGFASNECSRNRNTMWRVMWLKCDGIMNWSTLWSKLN